MNLEVPKLPESYLVGNFISGLSDEIKAGVRKFTPTTLSKAIELARLEEVGIELKQPKGSQSFISKTFNKEPYNTPTTGGTKLITSSYSSRKSLANTITPQTNATLPHGNRGILPSPVTPAKPIRRLSYNEYQQRLKNGLCFNSDEKYGPNHNCRKPQLFMITNTEDLEESEPEYPKQVEDKVEEEMLELAGEILLNAINGSSQPSTFKVVGHYHNQSFIILIDSGATHNFIDPSAAEKLNCSHTSTKPMLITVANREVIQNHMQCDEFKWKMQKQSFSTTLRNLPLGGCDVVLGMQWLETLGSVQLDFKKKMMMFQVKRACDVERVV